MVEGRFRIAPLTPTHLNEAVALVDAVFPVQGFERARWCFRASLESGSFSKLFFAIGGLRECRYWVMLDGDTNRVVGTTGLYSFKRTPEQQWLGWFALAPEVRGQGLGRTLLQFSIEQARAAGGATLALHTSNHRSERTAQKLYETVGLAVTSRSRYLWLGVVPTPYQAIVRTRSIVPAC